MTEIELAEPIIAWLRDHKWEVYQEVDLGNGVADIVALMGRRVWIIEVKQSFSLAVIAQAARWSYCAHWCSIAVPSSKQYLIRHFAERICRDYGIGVLYPRKNHVEERVPAALHRKADTQHVIKHLKEEQKTFAKAGNSNGQRWTPFKATCREIERFVSEHPGCNLKQLISGIETHYSSPASARGCISHWLANGVIKGIRIESNGKSVALYTEKP